MRTKSVVSLLVLFALSYLCVPAPTRAGDDWPPISADELTLKDNPASLGSQAMILYREQICDGTSSSENHYYRVKIFSDEGKKYADVEVPFLKGSQNVQNIRARTTHPDGRVIEFDGQVYEKLIVKVGGLRVLAKTFTLPDVSPGSIIEYRYRIQRDSDYVYGATWPVEGELYTKRARFVYKPFQGVVRASLIWRTVHLPANVKPEKQKDGSYALEVSDVAGLPKEEYGLPEDDLRGHIEFVYTDIERSNNADDFWNKVAKNWADENDHFIGKHAEVRQAAEQAFSPNDPPETRLRKLYARAQQIHNTTQEENDKTAQEEKREKLKDNSNVADVLKHGAGSGFDINRLFVGLAQAAGFDAGIVWVAPRNQAMFDKGLQDEKELQADIAWVHAGERDYFLDPATTLCPFGMLPWYEDSVTGFRPTKQGAAWMAVPGTPGEKSATERSAQLVFEDNGWLVGPFDARFTGQRALQYREDTRQEDEAGQRKFILNEIKYWFPSNAKFEITSITGWDKADEPIEVKGNLRLPGMFQSAGRRVLMTMGLYDAGRPQLFEHASRQQPVYFSFPYEEADDVTIRLPQTFRVETIPPPQTLEPGGKLHYEISEKQEGDTIHFQRKLVVGGILYQVGSYAGIRKFFSTAKADDDQQAVLQPQAVSAGRQ
ncbi:MAG TPA: DUF3857 domain-containing protein [Candidatus Acidoferrales bacterium]|nr:DUF3857 domain-containing protein [Candidatus Acidoferrales bacterium]